MVLVGGPGLPSSHGCRSQLRLGQQVGREEFLI